MGTRPNLSYQEQDQDQILSAWDRSYNKTKVSELVTDVHRWRHRMLLKLV